MTSGELAEISSRRRVVSPQPGRAGRRAATGHGVSFVPDDVQE
ncbi:MAG: hypothetical protein ACRCY9_06465 [Phycicoccus sp.]